MIISRLQFTSQCLFSNFSLRNIFAFASYVIQSNLSKVTIDGNSEKSCISLYIEHMIFVNKFVHRHTHTYSISITSVYKCIWNDACIYISLINKFQWNNLLHFIVCFFSSKSLSNGSIWFQCQLPVYFHSRSDFNVNFRCTSIVDLISMSTSGVLP